MFSFNQPNCITHCLLREAPRCRGRRDRRVRDDWCGSGWKHRGGAFPISRGILERLMLHVCWRSSTLWASSKLLFAFNERKQQPVWIQGQTGDRQGVQTDYVIPVMNASSTFRAPAALKAEHSPSWTMVSLIMSNVLSSSRHPPPPQPCASSSFPSLPTATSSSSFSQLHPHWPHSYSPTTPILQIWLTPWWRYIRNVLLNTSSSKTLFLLQGWRKNAAPRQTERDRISASCSVVITSRRISLLPQSARVTGILILIGGLQLDVSFHLGSGTAVVAWRITAYCRCRPFIHGQMKLHREQ